MTAKKLPLRSFPLSLLLLTAWLALAKAPCGAAETPDWELTVNFPMVWLPDISGEIDIDGESIDLDIPIEDVLEHLDTGFIGELYLRRGNWGLAWRSMYLATKNSSKTNAVGLPGLPPILGSQEITVSSELFTSDLIVDYSFNEHLGIYTGIRRTGTRISIKARALEPGLVELPGRTELANEELNDWIVGVNLQYEFARAWTAALQVDALVDGDNDSDTQLNAFVAYRFNPRNSIWFGYRRLQISQVSRSQGSRVETDFTQQGPTLGWAFTF